MKKRSIIQFLRKGKFWWIPADSQHLFVYDLLVGKGCGFPGKPRNGTYQPGVKVFYPGDEVEYTCSSPFILKGIIIIFFYQSILVSHCLL